MKHLRTYLVAGAAAALTMGPFTLVHAQAVDASATVADHGDWTLKQRESWLDDRLDKANSDGSLDHHEYERVRSSLHQIRDEESQLRDAHDGQLTDNENANLEAKLDGVADQIHWLHEQTFQKPW